MSSSSDALIRGTGSLGICTLWTDPKKIAKLLQPHQYAVIGHLYSTTGIRMMFRTILSEPWIKGLVLIGNDQSLTDNRKLLLDYFNNTEDGLDNIHRVTKISRETLQLLYHTLIFHDFSHNFKSTSFWNPEILTSTLDRLNALSHSILTREIIELEEPIVHTRISTEATAHSATTVLRETVSLQRVWKRLMNEVNDHGVIKHIPDYNVYTKELLNIVVTFPDPSLISQEEWEEGPYNSIEAEKYRYSLLHQASSNIEEGSYSYGERVAPQVNEIIRHLKANPSSRRVVLNLWRHFDQYSQNPPCLTQIYFLVTEDKLHVTAHFRSHDLYKAWCLNVISLLQLQKSVSEILSLNTGEFTVISHSAHIYQQHWMPTNFKLVTPFKLDVRGHFLISISSKKTIIVEHQNSKGEVTRSWEGDLSSVILKEILNSGLVTDLSHAAYLGRELEKASIALNYQYSPNNLNFHYSQDEPLTLVMSLPQ